MKCHVGYSAMPDIGEALAEACREFSDGRPALILFFSDSPRFTAFSKELHRLFPQTIVMGAATHTSFSCRGACRYGISIAALAEDICVAAGHLDELSRNPMKYKGTVIRALRTLEIKEPGRDNTVCFILNPAGTGCEELALDVFSDVLEGQDIPFLGGSASSEDCERGCVSLNGTVYGDSTVFVFLHLERGHFYIYQENIFEPMNYEFTVTRADVENRRIYELDGYPAAAVLCRALQVPFEALEEALHRHPLGRTPQGKLFITEVEGVNADGSITTYCHVFNQSRIALLSLRDFRQTQEETLDHIHAALPHITCSFLVQCYSRTQLYAHEGWLDIFTQRLHQSLGACAGLTSHGEQLNRFFLNMTLLILSLGE